MSTQAPTADPGEATPRPVAEGDGDISREPDQGEQHLPDPSKVRKAKAKLPGVIGGHDPSNPADVKLAKALGRDPEGGDGFDLSPGDGPDPDVEGDDGDVAPAKKAAGKAAGRERGPDGKFLKAGETATDEGGDTQGGEGDEGAVETAPDAPEDAAPEPPEGSELPQTLEEAHEALKKTEQRYKSLQGMFTPLNSRLSEMTHQQSNAAKSAVAWKADSESKDATIADLKAKVAQYEGGNPASPSGQSQADQSARPGGSTQDRAAELMKSIPWNEYAAMKEQGDDVAALWLATHITNMTDQASKREIAALQERLDNFIKPIQENRETNAKRAAVANHTVQAFQAVAALKNDAGQAAFPELQDENTAEEVGRLWTQMQMDPQYLMTPAGIVQAILNYRFYHGDSTSTPPPASPDGDGNGNDPNQDPDQIQLNSRAVRSLASSRNASPPPRPGAQSEGDAIKSTLRGIREVDGDLGFPTKRTASRR